MLFQTTTDGVRQLVKADSQREAAAIAERQSEGAAQVICVDRFGPVETTNWPFPSSSNREPVPATVLVGEALL